jgi:hypothetical protein
MKNLATLVLGNDINNHQMHLYVYIEVLQKGTGIQSYDRELLRQRCKKFSAPRIA